MVTEGPPEERPWITCVNHAGHARQIEEAEARDDSQTASTLFDEIMECEACIEALIQQTGVTREQLAAGTISGVSAELAAARALGLPTDRITNREVDFDDPSLQSDVARMEIGDQLSGGPIWDLGEDK